MSDGSGKIVLYHIKSFYIILKIIHNFSNIFLYRRGNRPFSDIHTRTQSGWKGIAGAFDSQEFQKGLVGRKTYGSRSQNYGPIRDTN